MQWVIISGVRSQCGPDDLLGGVDPLVDLGLGEAGQAQVDGAEAAGHGDEAELALHPVLGAPLAELAQEGDGDLDGGHVGGGLAVAQLDPEVVEVHDGAWNRRGSC